MRKTLSIIATATILATSVACGRTSSSMIKVETTNPLSYKQYTPKSEVIEGNQTAVGTLSKLLGTKVSVGTDWPEGSGLGINPVVTEEKEQYTVYEVEDYSEGKTIVFLFKDDTEGVAATEQNMAFVKDDSIDMSWKDQNSGINKCDYAFAYHNGKTANAIVSSSVGTVTSVWGVDEKTAEAQLIWADIYDCPIWQNYMK